jgi:hypothetical protein
MIGGWLHRRTCYAAATAMRGERRRLIREREALEMNSLSADDALASVAPVLDEAINQLADEDREAITLRFFERFNLRAIGEAMGTTEAAAQKRVARALEKLRGLLVRRGVVLSATGLALAVGSASATAAPAGLAMTISTAALTSAPAGAGFTWTTLKIMALTKLKITLIAVAVALVAAGTATTVVINRDPSYTPPPHPDPQKIMYEAAADTRAGRYKDALAKNIWYRNNALRYQPSLLGVRDSFALMYWSELAGKHPPAMKKLKAIRADAEKQVRGNKAGEQAEVSAFLTVLSINDGLKEEQKNVELFKWLDTHNSTAATRVYPATEQNLIHAGEYALCGRYMDADNSYQRILDSYQQMKKMPGSASNPQLMDFAVKNFSNQSATLVAVLAINNRNDEADQVASKAAREIHNPEFATLLAEAKNGKVPARWP